MTHRDMNVEWIGQALHQGSKDMEGAKEIFK